MGGHPLHRSGPRTHLAWGSHALTLSLPHPTPPRDACIRASKVHSRAHCRPSSSRMGSLPQHISLGRHCESTSKDPLGERKVPPHKGLGVKFKT